MREHAARTLAVGETAARVEPTPTRMIVQWHLEHRLPLLDDTPAALCFGRLDEEAGEHLVRRAPPRRGRRAATRSSSTGGRRVSTPFYRATAADPLGLAPAPPVRDDGPRARRPLRRGLRRPRLVHAAAPRRHPRPAARRARARAHRRDARHRRHDPGRAGRRDPRPARRAASSCRAARAPARPRSGLHRAAFLLYEHRELLDRERRARGRAEPRRSSATSRRCCPSLGETAVAPDHRRAARAAGRAGRAPSTRPTSAALKGDARMAECCAARCGDRIDGRPTRRGRRHRFGADPLAVDEVGEARRRSPRRATCRRNVRARALPRRGCVRLALAAVPGSSGDGAGPASRPPSPPRCAPSTELQAALDRIWPLADRRRRWCGGCSPAHAPWPRRPTACSTADEQPLLLRRSAAAGSTTSRGRSPTSCWSTRPRRCSSGAPATYGHVVVDEAQDLSAMELRLLARRVPEPRR